MSHERKQMLRRMIAPVLFGIVGTWILVSLGLWQLDRADQKAALIAELEARIFDAPVALPAQLSAEEHRYLPVEVEGRFLPAHVFVLAAQKASGPGFHLVQAFETVEGRRILVERGFLPEAARASLTPEVEEQVRLAGNLHWPRDINQHTPGYDAGRNLLFGRDVSEMAALLDTEEVHLVLRAAAPADPVITPVPVYDVTIPDPHLGYAVQWFLMAVAWLGMTVFFLWRIRAQRD
ncbi:SURF1 family protein [Roseinatronobacter bogoriensis]|uniref:SURF1-like protein n=2 Tax=Roseinatronobacter bogoriensis TaxID=119542 RepID=A0A2K8KBJ1_9RHOB|nr:SURF1 family protein [Rhodobaca bogoriensis]ATX66811.1 SURF1 family protein [Rhodobaca barguzinensis]